MGTASTKSQGRKQVPREKEFKSSFGREQAARVTDGKISQTTWLFAMLVVLVIAAFLRFYDLDLVPLHHDEGVNGNFLTRLVREGHYQYDPANYHGPTLYYLSAIFPWLLKTLFGKDAQNNYGLTTTAIRTVTALFGLGTVGLVFLLRRWLGDIGALTAALLLAISPGAVYLSRYFIHETLFVFFTLGIVVAVLKFHETGQGLYLLLTAVSAAMLFATKETAIISLIVLLIAWIVTVSYTHLRDYSPAPAVPVKKKKRDPRNEPPSELGFSQRAGGPSRILAWVVLAILVFIALNVLLYSSFFQNFPKGVYDAVKTFQFWTKTGKEHHVHPPLTYIKWLFLQESPVLVLGALGALLFVLKPRRRVALFCALWGFGLTAAYSLIAYKTPWLTLNFVVPLALTSGATLDWIYDEMGDWELGQRTRIYALAGILVATTGLLPGLVRGYARENVQWKSFLPAYQATDLNFINYDNDDRYFVYVYAHTRRETLKLLTEIDAIANRAQGGQTGITIVSSDYWPLPWYLRDYSRVGYYGRMTTSNEPIIISSVGQAGEVESTFGDRYQRVRSGVNSEGSFALRPGVDLLLYTRRELIR